MARIRAGSVDVEDLPVGYTRGHNKPIGWHDEARCRSDAISRASSKKGGLPSLWLVKTDETYVFVGRRTSGAKLIELALLECAMCPVQWDCARFAVQVREPLGTWAMSIEDREWLQDQPIDADVFIKQAESDCRPIQHAVRDARATGP